jgi:hypothetical protein
MMTSEAPAPLAATCEQKVKCDYGDFRQRRGVRPDSISCTAPIVSGWRDPCGRRNHGRN